MGFVSRDLKQFFKALNIYNGRIILYGAGKFGKRTYNALTESGYSIFAFCDANSEKIGGEYCSKPILNISQVAQMNDYAVVICVLDVCGNKIRTEICKSLTNAGVINIFDISVPEITLNDLQTENSNFTVDSDNIQVNQFVYRSLNEYSRLVFTTWLNFSLSGNVQSYADVPDLPCTAEADLEIKDESIPDFIKQLLSVNTVKIQSNTQSFSISNLLFILICFRFSEVGLYKCGSQLTVWGEKQ